MRMRTTTMLAALWVLALTPALLADVVPLRSGNHLEGEVVAASADGVTLETSSGTVRIPADQIQTPAFIGFWERFVSEEDVTSLTTLARLSAETGLFPEARRFLARAEAVATGEQAEALLALRVQIHEDDAARRLERVRALVADQEYETALEQARQIVASYADTPSAEPARELADTCIQGLEAQRERALEDAAAALVEEGDRARQAKRLRLEQALQRAQEAKRKGDASRDQLVSTIDAGNRTKMREHLEGAERSYSQARKLLIAVRQSTKEDDLRASARKALEEIDGSLVRLYLRVGQAYADEKNWKRADEAATKALALAPNDSAAQEFKEYVAKNRLRRSVSDTTNAGPRVTNGGP